MKKKLLAILVAATCLASILVLPVPAYATDPNEEGLTVAENFSGSKINHNCALEYGSFKTTRIASPRFAEKDGMTTLRGASSTNYFDYLKADMKHNTLTRLSGKTFKSDDWGQWRLVFKKDSSGNYHSVGIVIAENDESLTKMRYAYNVTLQYSESPSAINNNWNSDEPATITDSTGLTKNSGSNIKNCWLDFSMDYDYENRTVNISYSNPSVGWKCNRVYTLAADDEPVCMLLSYHSTCYLADISLNYSDKNSSNHKLDYTYDETGHWGECSCGIKSAKESHFIADTKVENGMVKSLCVCGYEMKSAKVKENGFTEDFAGGKINNADYLSIDRLDTINDSGVKYEFVDRNENGNYSLKGGNDAAYAPYLNIAMKDKSENKLVSSSGRITVNGGQNQWALTFKKDSSDNYHMFALWHVDSGNKLRMNYIYETVNADDGGARSGWKSTQKLNNGTSIIGENAILPTDGNMGKGMYFDYIMKYDFSAKTVDFTWYNDELKWKFTHTETLSDTDTPVCMLVSRATSSKPSYIENVSAVYEAAAAPSVKGVSLTTNDDGVIDSNDTLDLYFNIDNPNAEVTGYSITQSGTVMMLKNKYDTNGNELYIGVKGSVEAKTDEFFENYSAILLGSRAKVPGHKIAARPYVVYTSETDPSDSFVCYGDVYDAHSVYSCFSAIHG